MLLEKVCQCFGEDTKNWLFRPEATRKTTQELPRRLPGYYPETDPLGQTGAQQGHNKILSLMAENPQICISALVNAMRSLGESNEDNTESVMIIVLSGFKS